MNYYFDTEFIEGFYKPPFGRRRHFIGLISIGIVAEDGREYYAISSEFKARDADDWVRQNVLCPLVTEYLQKYVHGDAKINHPLLDEEYIHDLDKSIYWIQRQIGKTNKQIAAEIKLFIANMTDRDVDWLSAEQVSTSIEEFTKADPPVFYAYYADYDWVLFCSLFGRMIDLPKGYPMHCNDLKQDMDRLGLDKEWKNKFVPGDNEHHALSDARWNKKLFEAMVDHLQKSKMSNLYREVLKKPIP